MSCSPSEFVPSDLDASDWKALEPLYTALLDRELKCHNCLAKLILDRSDLDAATSEAGANLYIATTRRTDDKEVEKAFQSFVENVEPNLKKISAALDRKIADSEHAGSLDQERYGILLRALRTDIDLYREENIAIETEITLLDQKYNQVCGAMTVEFEGREQTMPEMGQYLQSTSRGRRETAWRAIAERRLKDRDTIDDLFEQLLERREQLAKNTGFDNFRDYQHRRMHRYDYTPQDCFSFHEAVETHCVPLLRSASETRRKALAAGKLRPWDVAVDIKGREPLRPFSGADELIDGTSRLYHRMDDRLAAMFDELGEGDCLDLETRKGKAPGGYQYQREQSRKPFIFMNAAGLHRDLVTMVHEAGHAFHSMSCREEPILAYRSAPMEFCEVASMAQELLVFPYLDAFYPDGEEADRARRNQLEDLSRTLCWVATIDAFQQWIYTNPGHDRDARTAKWLELHERFGEPISWKGLEEEHASLWHRQLHIFGVPFYYIEYGIAQLGALQVWANSLEGEADAIKHYLSALSLGGSKSLPELFEAAGATFDLGPETVGPLMSRVEEALESLPA
ncbi:MAG: peptidase M3 [Planctomycetaceae bacterium]|nr:peptidase M3 [Planctomycetaceae bacterium]